MILISHRGNTNGRFESYENEPNYIDAAIGKGYQVEVDAWCIDNQLYLGHDKPLYGENLDWFFNRIDKLWIHCKNVEAINIFQTCGFNFNYFWHESDTLTITSRGFIWAHTGKQPINNSIGVLPELAGEVVSQCIGVCSDYIENYKR